MEKMEIIKETTSVITSRFRCGNQSGYYELEPLEDDRKAIKSIHIHSAMSMSSVEDLEDLLGLVETMLGSLKAE